MNEEVSSCERDHLISIQNFEDNAVVPYSVVLIKGTIRNARSCNEKLYIKQSNKQGLICSITCLVHNLRFKCLVQLQPDYNSLNLTYCRSNLTFTLNYNIINLSNVVTPILLICDDDDDIIQGPEQCDKSLISCRQRLIIAVQLMQCFFAEKLFENTSFRKTFSIETENGFPVCIVFRSKLSLFEAQNKSEEYLWQYFGRELMTSKYASQKRKYLAFILSSKYVKAVDSNITYDIIKRNTKCYASVGKGNLALFGNPYFYTWPEKMEDVLQRFEDCTPETFVSGGQKTEPLIQTVGGCYSLSFGAALHELGHIFDLGHSQYGLMGREYINIDKVFSFGRYDINPQAPYCEIENNCNENGNASNYNKRSFTVLKKVPSITSKVNQHANIDKYFASILFYHKWFNNHISPIFDNSECFKYNFSINELISLNFLVIIQLRDVKHELVKHSFIPNPESCKWIMNAEHFGKSWYLFAIDVVGNIFHCITKC